MSTLKTNNAQIGQSATANQNFTLYQPASPDGTVRLGVGNSGATTSDALTVTNAGNATLLGNLTVSGAGTSTFAGTLNATTALQSGGVAAERIVLGTAQATTSGTSFEYTGLPSWAKKITMQFSDLSSTTASPTIQMGSGSYTTSGYKTVYQSTPYTSGFVLNNYGFSSGGVSGNFIFTLANSSTNLWVGSFALIANDATSYSTNVGGYIALAGVLDRIRITVASGTFNRGAVNITYEG